MIRKLIERKNMQRKKKKPPKIKNKLVLKINLLIITIEWHIEFGE
jgi:hypothetical protein